LHFVHFDMNGADNVLRYQKWKYATPNRRSITIGRKGYTESVLSAIAKTDIDHDEGIFIVGPELPNISSSAVRKALKENNIEALQTLLHPSVQEWCISEGRYRRREPGTWGPTRENIGVNRQRHFAREGGETING
jgi:nicotinic acid mononucleotide adenylyltransferase